MACGLALAPVLPLLGALLPLRGLACGLASVLRLRCTASSKGGGEDEGGDGSHGGLGVGEVEGSGDANR